MFVPRIVFDEPEEVKPLQLKFLNSLLKEWNHLYSKSGSNGVSLPFRFDVNGTSHWEGEMFEVLVSINSCTISRGSAVQYGYRNGDRNQRVVPIGSMVDIGHVDGLDAEELLSAIGQIIVQDIMRF